MLIALLMMIMTMITIAIIIIMMMVMFSAVFRYDRVSAAVGPSSRS